MHDVPSTKAAIYFQMKCIIVEMTQSSVQSSELFFSVGYEIF